MKTIVNILFFLSAFTSILAQSHRSEYLKYYTSIDLKGNNCTRSDSVVLQINERLGDDDANFSIVYQKGDKISFGDIWIQDMMGNNIRKVNKKEINDRSYITSSSLYSDLFIKHFEVKYNQYPYRLAYSVKITTNKYTSITSMNLSGYRIPIKEGKLVVTHSIDQPIKHKYQNVESYMSDTIATTVKHEWKYSHTPNVFKLAFNSVNNTTAPIITAAPIDFKFQINGDNTSWDTFGNWIYSLNLGRDKLTNDEISKIEDMTSKYTDDKEKVRVLYNYLQDNTRYINVSTKYGGLQTHPAEYVCINKYGDCKALSNYMQSMLKQVGIESFYTIIESDDRITDLEDDFSHNAFNHAILTVPIKSDTIFLECTSKKTPMGYVGTHIQGRKALLTKENGSKLVDMPKLTPADVLCVRDIDIHPIKNGDATITINAKERGSDYEFSSSLKNNYNKNTIDRFIRNYILEGSYEIENFKIENENRDSATINIDVHCIYKSLYKKYGNNLVILPLAMNIPRLEIPQERTADVQIDYPIHLQDNITYHLGDTEIKKTPDDIEVSTPYGDIYSVKYEQVGNTLKVYKQLLITSKRLELANYKTFYDFIVRARNTENSNLYIETL